MSQLSYICALNWKRAGSFGLRYEWKKCQTTFGKCQTISLKIEVNMYGEVNTVKNKIANKTIEILLIRESVKQTVEYCLSEWIAMKHICITTSAKISFLCFFFSCKLMREESRVAVAATVDDFQSLFIRYRKYLSFTSPLVMAVLICHFFSFLFHSRANS